LRTDVASREAALREWESRVTALSLLVFRG
jgi:hypothetical protein